MEFPVGMRVRFRNGQSWGFVADREWTFFHNLIPMAGIPVRWEYRPHCHLPADNITHIGIEHIEPWPYSICSECEVKHDDEDYLCKACRLRVP